MAKIVTSDPPLTIEREEVPSLLGALARQGYRVLGPKIASGALIYAEIASGSDLPAGWGDEQDGGTVCLRRARPEALFDFSVGQHSWKQFLLLF